MSNEDISVGIKCSRDILVAKPRDWLARFSMVSPGNYYWLDLDIYLPNDDRKSLIIPSVSLTPSLANFVCLFLDFFVQTTPGKTNYA